MPTIKISITKEEIEQLEEISQKEKRNYSKQLVHMMKFYIKQHEKTMDDLIGSGYYPSPEQTK